MHYQSLLFKERAIYKCKVDAYIYSGCFMPRSKGKSWVHSGPFATSPHITAHPVKANLILFPHQMVVCMDGKHGCQMVCVWYSQEQSFLIHHIYFLFQLSLCSSQSNILCLQKLLLQMDEVESHHILCDDDVHPGQSTSTKKNSCKTFR